MPEQPQQGISFSATPEAIIGSPATMAAVWHTKHEFVLDFLATNLPGPPGGVPQFSLVSRVRVPTTVIFDVAKAIAENVSNYEAAFGPITPTQPDGS